MEARRRAERSRPALRMPWQQPRPVWRHGEGIRWGSGQIEACGANDIELSALSVARGANNGPPVPIVGTRPGPFALVTGGVFGVIMVQGWQCARKPC